MNSIPEEMMSILRLSPDVGTRILCCGVDRTSTLYLITGNAELRRVKPNGYLIPVHASPDSSGKFVEMTFSRVEETHNLVSKVVIENSEDVLDEGSLFVNNSYVCDLKIESTETLSEDVERNEAAEAFDSRGSSESS